MRIAGRRVSSPLRQPQFAAVFIGEAISMVGNAMLPVLIVLQLLTLSRSAIWLGATMGAESVGYVLAVLLGGIASDRGARVGVVLVADALQIVGVAGLGTFATAATLALVPACGFIAGAGSGLYRPNVRALLATLSVKEGRLETNALISQASQVGALVGPVVAALLHVLAGRWAFYVDVGSFGPSVGVLVYLSARKVDSSRLLDDKLEVKHSVFGDARDGLKLIKSELWLASIITQGMVQMLLAIGPEVILLPLVLRRQGAEGSYGFVIAGGALAALIASRIIGRGASRGRGWLAMLGATSLAVEMFALAANAPVIAIGFAVAITAVGQSMFSITWFTAVQEGVDESMWGRVMAFDSLATNALAPIGLAITPLVAGIVGVGPVAYVGGAAMLLSGLLPLSLRSVRRLGPLPSGR